MFDPKLLTEIRARFYHVDACPYQGARIFFENAGGSLTLKSVVEVNTKLSAIPDNQHRDNPASQEMLRLIHRGREDMLRFLGAKNGWVFVGESGTECLFRAIRAATLAAEAGGCVLGSTLEHPATASALRQWGKRSGRKYIEIAHDKNRGTVDADAYANAATADTRVATVIQTSPVTGIAVDLSAIVAAIRAQSPQCFIIVDGIQHAPHGAVGLGDYDIDAYAVSAYKVFSRHNYGFAWLSDRLRAVAHDRLTDADARWELGTRDAAEYATFSEVVNYLEWLGAQIAADENIKIATTKTNAETETAADTHLQIAARAIAAHEQELTQAMLLGGDGVRGLSAMAPIMIIGGAENPHREGVVSFAVRDMDSAAVVAALSARGVRVHIRQRDCYAANILTPLNLATCIRVSICHYNSIAEVQHFLKAMEEIVD